ncbi:hypothetical protein Pcinc_007318 [Petrolisthes cinctipes]|uniref:PiggyBac transposable element-derived protein domain-containing protein n=1 Tax=Petrolisthes cinctipes TaxID=88211 RepID=A0AAE1KYM2_PETCI|nr:hypothetical protein Pcinc_007318 [Petrolisthes cinctipes]
MASEPQNDCNMDVGETSEEEFSEGSDIDLDSEDSDSKDDTHDVVADSGDNDSIPDHTSPDYQLYKVQSLINHFTKMFKHNFHSGERVSIDESMIGYRANTNAQRPLRRHDFLISLVHALVGDFRPFRGEKRRRSQEEIRAARARQDIFPPTDDVAQPVRVHNIIKLPGQTRRQCVGDHATRVRSRVKCSTCNVVVCSICVGKYHS